MAEVYVGRLAGPHGFFKRFAIKRILPHLAVDARFVEMFCDEARICAALSHPNIVQVMDFGEDQGQLFMAMEYVDGVSLARLLRAVAARAEQFPLGAALFIVHEVLRGLRFAHEARDENGRPLNIVHRDVSPGNILIARAGEVKLTDFGIVLSAFIDRRTYPGELKGKMGYMSPEQVIGDDLDPRSDLFTLGIVLAEMLLIRPLFPGRNELEMLTRMYEADLQVLERNRGTLPPELMEVLRTALARDREQRFQGARDFEDAIRGVARRLGIVLNDTQLVPWLSGLGILPNTSGQREVAQSPVPGPPSPQPGPRPNAPAERRHSGQRTKAQPPAADEPPRELNRPARSSSPTPRPESADDPDPALVRFHLQGRGRTVGPLTTPQLFELAATGRVVATTRVSDDGVEFRPLSSWPMFGNLVTRPAFSFGVAPDARCTWKRTLTRRELPGILFQLARRQETGLLLLQARQRQKRVFWEHGTPRCITSTERSELLGALLTRGGLLTTSDVERAVLVAGPRGQRLGETLVTLGLLRPTALLRGLVEQLESRFLELGRWHNGEVAFYRGVRAGEDRVNSYASGLSLTGRMLRQAYDDREIGLFLTEIADEPIARFPIHLDPQELQLTPAQRRALELAPGARSLRGLVSQLARDAGARPEDTLRGVFTGLSCGLLAMPGWASVEL